jgi:hypothetical protein
MPHLNKFNQRTHVVLPSIFNDDEFIGSPYEGEKLHNMYFPFGPPFWRLFTKCYCELSIHFLGTSWDIIICMEHFILFCLVLLVWTHVGGYLIFVKTTILVLSKLIFLKTWDFFNGPYFRFSRNMSSFYFFQKTSCQFLMGPIISRP